MPNWTYNRLTIEGEPADLEAFVEAVRGEEPADNGQSLALCFERHLPTPPELLEDRGEPEKGRFPEWRDWRREHWGTKWDAQWPEVIEREDGSITYSFATAWRPPDAWLAFVSGAHPLLSFQHEFCEEMGHFAGKSLWGAGALVEHEWLDPDDVEWMEWEEVEEE